MLATRLAAPVGQLPKAHRFDGMGVLGPYSESATVNDACAVFVSAASYDVNPAVPSRFVVKLPDLRSEYS